MTLGDQEITGAAKDFVYKDYHTLQRANRSLELIVTLAQKEMDAHLHYVVFPGVSVIEQWAEIENTGATPLPALTNWESFSIALRPAPDLLTLYWVQGLNPGVIKESKKDPVPTLRLRSAKIDPGNAQQVGSTGRSSEQAMGWFALTAPGIRGGMFGGIEWSGDWQLRVTREGDNTVLRAGLQGIRVRIAPGEKFEKVVTVQATPASPVVTLKLAGADDGLAADDEVSAALRPVTVVAMGQKVNPGLSRLFGGPVFENQFSVAMCKIGAAGKADPICGTEGNRLASANAFIQAADAGQRGPFSVELTYKVSAKTQAWVVVYDHSARDGGLIFVDSRGVVLMP
jgi:hypothetical protein